MQSVCADRDSSRPVAALQSLENAADGRCLSRGTLLVFLGKLCHHRGYVREASLDAASGPRVALPAETKGTSWRQQVQTPLLQCLSSGLYRKSLASYQMDVYVQGNICTRHTSIEHIERMNLEMKGCESNLLHR